MRVISQKSRPVLIDLPYEKIAVSQSYAEPNKIIGYDPMTSPDRFFYLAEYSTPEKAVKAMQKLHEFYTRVFVLNDAPNTEESIDKLQKLNSSLLAWQPYHKDSSIEIVNNLVFRFPEEDEL